MSRKPNWKTLHEQAVAAGRDQYRDPDTGFVVFTALFHQKRGTCCGSACRHCPFEHENVPRPLDYRSSD